MALAKKNKFSHNKKRNSGLVYEFLLRKISECVLDKNLKESKKALRVIKKYYNTASPLYEEKLLFDIIVGTSGASKRIASGVLEEVKKVATGLDFKKIDIKKSNLIKEINHTFGKSFFSSFDIDDYKALASIQLFVNGCNPKSTLVESVQRVKLEESLMNFMIVERRPNKEQVVEADELSYNLAVNRYNKKYTQALNESQQSLLSSYTSSLTLKDGKVRLEKYLVNQKVKLLGFLRQAHNISEVKKDKLISEKLNKAEMLLENMNFKGAGPKEIEDLMLYCKLVEEIASK